MCVNRLVWCNLLPNSRPDRPSVGAISSLRLPTDHSEASILPRLLINVLISTSPMPEYTRTPRPIRHAHANAHAHTRIHTVMSILMPMSMRSHISHKPYDVPLKHIRPNRRLNSHLRSGRCLSHTTSMLMLRRHRATLPRRSASFFKVCMTLVSFAILHSCCTCMPFLPNHSHCNSTRVFSEHEAQCTVPMTNDEVRWQQTYPAYTLDIYPAQLAP